MANIISRYISFVLTIFFYIKANYVNIILSFTKTDLNWIKWSKRYLKLKSAIIEIVTFNLKIVMFIVLYPNY